MHLNMKNKGQAGVIIVVILIIIVGVFFLYKAGYLNFNQTTTTTTKNINPYIPISFNISTSTPLAHLYTGENINVISKIFNNGKNYINVVAFPYGCSFLPVQNKSFSIPPDSPSSFSWVFSSSSPTSCSITFSACFNAVSYTNYPLTIESYDFNGTVPTSQSTSSAGLPINLGLEDFSPILIASPSSENQTFYVDANSLTSTGSTSKLNWVNIQINNGIGYFTSSVGTNYKIEPNQNITNQEYPLTFQNGRLLAPIQFSLLVNPVSNSVGYTSNVSINVSAGYTYCITSNSIPLSISQS